MENLKPSKSILVGICTFNPKDCKEVLQIWEEAIDALLRHNSDHLRVDVALFDNQSYTTVWGHIKSIYAIDSRVKFISLRGERRSRDITWNVGIMMIPGIEKYDYVAISAGDIIYSDTGGLQKLLDEIDTLGDVGIISPQVSDDLTVRGWYPKYRKRDDSLTATEVSLGEQVYCHFWVYTKQYLNAYGYRRPDILWGHMVETWYPFLCHAIGLKFYCSHKTETYHYGGKERMQDTQKHYKLPIIGSWDEFFNMFAQAAGLIAFEPNAFKIEMLKEMGGDDPERRYQENHTERNFDFDPFWYTQPGYRAILYRWIIKNLYLPFSYYAEMFQNQGIDRSYHA